MATEHFTDEELSCRCGCGGLPPQGFQDALEALRVYHGWAMRLTSAARCPEHNAKVSSTGLSGPHTRGAVDVGVSGDRAYELIQDALALGWTGIGVHQRGPHYGRYIHLDRLEGDTRPRVWSY